MKTIDKGRYYISHMTSKGQTTIPRSIRNMLGLKDGSELAFKPTAGGIVLVRVTTTVKEENPYTLHEWDKIAKLASEKGKTFRSEKAILKHLHRA